MNFESPSSYNKIISVGMLEHVGKYQYGAFFDKIASLLSGNGIALTHSMVEQSETSTDAWIDKNVFPGGYIPTISEVVGGIEHSRCKLVAQFTHDKLNYFRTLEAWKANLFAELVDVLVLIKYGLNASSINSIIRIWEYFYHPAKSPFPNVMVIAASHTSSYVERGR